MRTHFDKQLDKLNDELIEMGSMIEKAIEHTIKALVTQDIDLANYVIESDEQVNRQERDIVSEASVTAAAGSERSASDFLCAENDYGYGAYRRSRR